MEIQGVCVPLDVLKYITQFLWVKDHREDFKRVCQVFYRAIMEDPPRPLVYIVPEYGSAEGGLVQTVENIVCYTKRFKVTAYPVRCWWDGLVRFDVRPGIQDDRIFCDILYRPFPCSTRHVESSDLQYFCTETGRIGRYEEIRTEDKAELVEEMRWLYHLSRRHIKRMYEQVNERKLLKHKRPRKRVKRLGFD